MTPSNIGARRRQCQSFFPMTAIAACNVARALARLRRIYIPPREVHVCRAGCTCEAALSRIYKAGFTLRPLLHRVRASHVHLCMPPSSKRMYAIRKNDLIRGRAGTTLDTYKSTNTGNRMRRFFNDTELLGYQSAAPARSLAAGMMWLRLGFVAASAGAIALTTLWSSDAKPLYAFLWTIGAAAVAAFAWRRSWTIVNRIDEDSATGPATPRAVPRSADRTVDPLHVRSKAWS